MPASVRRFDSRRAACLHLFRSLDDVRALRANPLAARICRDCADGEVVANVRAAIAAATQEMLVTGGREAFPRTKRLAEIVMRCDLAGEPHKVVAADLGLSLRQFYRERARAVVEIGERLDDGAADEREGHACVFDPYAIELQRAATLAHAGCASNAIALLQRLAAESAEPALQVRARTALAELLTESSEPERAACEIENATRVASRIESSEAIGEAYAAIELATSALANVRGALVRARAALERAEVHLHERGGIGARRALELFVHGKILAANLEIKEGNAQRALASLAAAQHAMDAFEDVPATTSIEYYMHLHEASVTAISDARAMHAYERALALAQANGFATDATIASVYRAQYLANAGDAPNAVATARQALDVGSRVMTEYQFALLQMLVGEIEIESNCGPAAVERMQHARSVLQAGGADWARSVMLEASGRLECGDFAGAVRGSSAALHAFRTLGNERWAGTSLRILAEGFAGLGRVADARRTVAEAVRLLEGYGHPQALLRAYTASARICGNREHARTARELQTALRRVLPST